MTPSERGPRRSLRDRAREQREHEASPRATNSSGERVFLIGIDARHAPKRGGASAPNVPDDEVGAPPFPNGGSEKGTTDNALDVTSPSSPASAGWASKKLTPG